jgi:hypothetical protein
MKKVCALLGASIMILSWPVQILAAESNYTNHIVISEIQTSSLTDASQEFIELYNPTNSLVKIDNWIIEYASSSGASWSKKATLTGSINGFGFYLIGTSQYSDRNSVLSAGIAASGGHIRIKNQDGNVVDQVGWGSAAHAEGAPIGAPAAGGSIERLPGRLNQLAGNGLDTDANNADFVLRDVAEPQSATSLIEDPSQATEPVEDPVEEAPVEEVVITPPLYLPVVITEAFPDPASPLTDAKDEFIELYNPNNQAVNLKGYVLRTGSGFKSYYTLGEIILEPGAYIGLFSVDTGLGLPNSGSAVQILDPLGNIVDVSDAYGPAKTGQSWAKVGNVWGWTLEPTAGAANVLKTVNTAAASGSTKKAAVKKASAKKTTTKKAASKKSKAAAKKSKSKSTKSGIDMATTAITEPSPLARWLLIAAGCFTIMYALYGFRYDIYNYFIKARRHTATWLSNRAAVSWWRNYRAR